MPQFAVPVAAEAAVATTMTAAEIAAAQAAATHAAQVTAAQVLAAEQAAALAAQQATAAAATNTAAATATNAATNQSVLNAIGAGGGAPASVAQLGGLNSLGAGAGGAGTGGISNLGYETLAQEVTAGLPTTEIQTLPQVVNAANYPLPSAVPTVPSVPNVVPSGAEFIPPSNFGPPPTQPMSQAQYDFIHNSVAGGTEDAARSIIQNSPVVTSATPGAVPTPAAASPAPPANSLYQFKGPDISLQPPAGTFSRPDPLFNITPSTTQGVIPRTSLESSLTPSGDPFYNVNSGAVNSMGYQRPLYDLTSTGVDATAVTPAAPQEPGGLQGLFNQGLDYAKNNKLSTALGANTLYNYLNKPDPYEEKKYKSTFKPGLYTGYTPVQPTPYQPQYAVGGLADLGGYSDGGRMLKGPGDGMSDDIPATIANKQPARLANEEFVIPADVVSHLGNGSSEAGAKQLYKMMDRVRKARTGNKKQGKQINPDKYLA